MCPGKKRKDNKGEQVPHDLEMLNYQKSFF